MYFNNDKLESEVVNGVVHLILYDVRLNGGLITRPCNNMKLVLLLRATTDMCVSHSTSVKDTSIVLITIILKASISKLQFCSRQ